MEETQTQPNTSDSTSSRRPWSFESNWTIYGGSLDASVTVESFDLPIQSDNTTPKPPLVLQPSSSGSGPCEIKISFTQKHEIRQVYVRSTARVYEIYYASSAQSDNEYLCTVRCSIADKENDLHHTSAIQGASTGEPAEGEMVGGSNISPRENDWVEVKIPTATRSFRDFYEATAEISDVDPCMSITLRLLSLQSEGCVYVDEVYVFADTVESADSEHQAVQVENSAGTNLMAMLVPTLMQLTKSRAAGLEDNRASSSKEKQVYLEIESGKSSSTKTAGGIQQAEQSKITGLQHVGLLNSQAGPSWDQPSPSQPRLQPAPTQPLDPQTYGATLEPNHFQVPAEVPNIERSDMVSKNAHSCNQIEIVLEQLVSRMSRIEDICLRFEDNMVKPINSMLERLERVEQQVEVLAKNSPQCPRFPSGTIFTAPEFSNESNSSSFNEGNSSQSCGPSEIEKKNITTTPDISSQPDDKSRFLPSLMVTAPEFSCCDDEEENVVLEPQKGSPQGKPKQTLSIDDALAVALAGFSSTTLVPSPNDTEAFATPIPEFATEVNGGDILLEHSEPPVVKLSSGVADSDEHVVFKVAAPEFTGEEKGNDVADSDEHVVFKVAAPEFTGEEKGNEEKVSEPNHPKAKPLGPSGSCRIEEIMCENHSISTSTRAEIVDCPSAEEDDFGLTSNEPEKSNLTSKISASDNISDNAHTVYQINDGSDSALFDDNPSIRDTKSPFDKEISPVITRPPYPSIVDFEIPILEVKFVSGDKSSANSTLEALLTDVTETLVKYPQQESNGDLISREMKTEESVENGEAISSRAGNHLLVELDGYGVEEVSTKMAGDGIKDHQTCINQVTFASLI